MKQITITLDIDDAEQLAAQICTGRVTDKDLARKVYRRLRAQLSDEDQVSEGPGLTEDVTLPPAP